jgi:purine nucleosidase
MTLNHQSETIILDTDIGSDIDDALALSYLLKQPDCTLVGITTVTGEPELRAKIASALCIDAGRSDIPIHVGAPVPLLVPIKQPEATQASAALTVPSREFDLRPTAVDFLRATIRANPGAITLFAIGPLTNIALLFRIDPEIPALLKSLVLMGGHFIEHPAGRKCGAEWNILCDPHAAAIVFSADIDILAVGLDVTTQCSIPSEECATALTAPGVPKLIPPMAEIWLRRAANVVFHDPLAAALIFRPGICTYQRGTIEVELASNSDIGRTYWTPSESGSHRIAVSVDSAAFFAHYFETLRFGTSDE